MESITYTSHYGRTTVGSQKKTPDTSKRKMSFLPSQQKGTTRASIGSSSSKERIKINRIQQIPTRSFGRIFDNEEGEAQTDEFDKEEFYSFKTLVPREDNISIEEEKNSEEKDIKPKESHINSAADNQFKQSNKLQKLASKTLIVINTQKLKKNLIPQGSVKDSKSPDPFESQHVNSEKLIMNFISSSTNSDNPLHNHRKSGSASLRAYKHYIISLFESACFIREMTPIEDYQIQHQVQILKKPHNVLCNLYIIIN